MPNNHPTGRQSGATAGREDGEAVFEAVRAGGVGTNHHTTAESAAAGAGPAFESLALPEALSAILGGVGGTPAGHSGGVVPEVV